MRNPLLPLAPNGRKMNNTVLVSTYPGGNPALTDPRTLQVQITEFLCPDSSPEEGRGHPPVPVPVRDRGDSMCQATGMVSDTQQRAPLKNGSHVRSGLSSQTPFPRNRASMRSRKMESAGITISGH